MPTKKTPTSYRLSDEAQDMIARLAILHGCSATQAVEMAVREKGRRDKPPPLPDASPARPQRKRGEQT